MTKATKLWEKKGSALHPAVHPYIIDKNQEADNALLPFDVQGSKAHVAMLAEVGLLDKADAERILPKLDEIIEKHASGAFQLRPENEDVHTEIENYLVRELGDIGKRIHVGRSRNDQVLTDMRLYTKSKLHETIEAVKNCAGKLLEFAKTHEFVPMTGFTHMQHAMPSSVGQWAGAFVESLLVDAKTLQSALEVNDMNPLGSAAGFGTAMPLDREHTTKALGFERVQINPIYCQNSRGKLEGYTISTLMQIMLTLGKFANDMVIFTNQEFNFFNVEKSLTTGSSIMPQKRNLDVMEVMRANVSIMQSLQMQVQTVGVNLISGYNKDLKITKKPLMQAFDIAISSLHMAGLVIEHTSVHEEELLKAFDDVEIYAADVANELVQSGMSFRDAYKQVGENLASLEARDPEENIRAKTHIGSTGNLCLDVYAAQLQAL